jgi:hypothetical protein
MIWEVLLELARRFLPTPQDRQEFEKLVMEAKAQEAKARAKEREQMTREFITLLETTQPTPDRVYVWANTLIALVRPTVTLLIIGSVIWLPDRLKEFLAMASASPTGFYLIMAPVLWWFFGRDINKFLGRDGLGVIGGVLYRNGNRSGAGVIENVRPTTDKPQPPKPYTAVPSRPDPGIEYRERGGRML